ncbi:PREDICTED: uncharacterized protein LOC105569849 [Vollenhovia emeryi]|uniref:uncharacterized protein LOC105569849 n=1 Tax=Vollenhovia emeryi TaxID=411798 RepID=UPI0005F54D11|nr:PREDICTED: uncharacterized protein LOC105569849 [Vollenhovia emeryi]XP_011882008.1 PREDICTED: uncharacterized protein LOC105569849 [Vollenhovia emeryi]XP_011882009.1 PREDICTED: uncharacterized protein LOC105569849 [Vollenhovia emeryi]
MDFQSINPLNVRLNLLSGNLLPMTDNSSFPTFWRLYSIFVWLFELFYTVTLIAGCFFVPIEKVLNDGIVILIVIVEANFQIIQILTHTTLVEQLIRKLNAALNTEDENLKKIVITNLKPMETPFKFYLTIGTLSASFWCCMPLPLIFEKDTFYYSDFRAPGIYSKEPFSSSVFLLGTVLTVINNIYIFIKKVSVDIYVTHLISLITSQYQYIASRFVLMFRNTSQQDNSSFLESNTRVDVSVEREIKKLCRQHNNILYITLMLKKLLSVNIFFIYLNNVFRFCFLGVMLSNISASFLEGSMVFMYGSGSITQFYILCNCFQKLTDATSEITDKAFHEDWNRFSLSVKRTFLMVIMASNNMDLRISLFERFNLSLPSFMSILNQSYSIALLLLRVK